MRTSIACLLAAMVLFATGAARAADATQAEIDALKKDVEQLRKQLSAQTSGATTRSSVEKALDCKYGPNATVTTKSGKLTVGGLLQVWFYTINNDSRGLYDNLVGSGVPDSNQTQDNDSFRIRRAELRFTMDIHENITSVVMIDPAQEAASFPGMPYNQGLLKLRAQGSPEFEANNGFDLATAQTSAVQNGSGAVPRLLQDAYINYHGVIPHHDFTVGQFLPALGEEAIRSSAQLDFVERAMISQLNNERDLGASLHGTWWDERFQYWIGAFDGAANYLHTNGVPRNRADNNDDKDFNYRVLVRPLWKQETWGSLELGMSSQFGSHGESGHKDPTVETGVPIAGLNVARNWAIKHAAFASYMPGGPVKGLWVRGEWAWFKDRNAALSVYDPTDASSGPNGYLQGAGSPVVAQGWYVSAGYKIADSTVCDKVPAWLKPFEFALRYETMQNVMIADLVTPNTQTNLYKTEVFTGGINYYIKGNNAKVQFNYNAVRNPDGGPYNFHPVDNDNFVVNFQVAF